MVKLRKLLNSIGVLEASNEKDLIIRGISYHSQKVGEGHLFVCIKGYKTDGHKYLSQAVEKGAVAAVVEEFQEGIDIPQYLVENSRIALAQLGAAFYNNPSKAMKMIGITATNGKTTTSYMTNAILENHGLKTGLIGTVSIKIDDESIPAELTTPESLDLQCYLNEMVERDVSHVTMEVSSSALELHRIKEVDYDIVSFNNISREHIDAHGSFEKYYEFKSSLVINAKESSIAVLNLDCPYSAVLADHTKAQVITFGVGSREGHIHCKNLDLSTGRGRFTVEILKPFKVHDIEYSPTEFDIELSVPGLHSVYNSMVAITIGLLCGIPIDTIQKTLRTFTGVERRFEFIFEDDIKIIDDHFANPGNINVTLQTLDYMDYKNLHLVYAIRGERGPTVNRENSEAIVKWSSRLGFDEVIATKSVSHVTSKDKVTDEELHVFQEVMSEANIKVNLYDELTDAIAHALSKAEEGDLILLAGCQGMDYGAEIALQQLHVKKAEYPVEKLFYPLRNRVAGISNDLTVYNISQDNESN
ncbi:Mur ligase family protein [Natronincola ferrireducens]|uniref:UDP-N-acetylmuramoylalanyl-D-glutamate--2,6-diaminopimelate ligase n=1 Tax=Natronincola ferrireducens TaxID=393762 RepID=A0A1G9DSA4_9FIRM|nr:UDP-N-acetylmuramoyl-L-alanyl-D-glutamate--2,6-diaminopimelate ligase [Natronincola ferrireducens]SDK66753.1 UDP-N-acetylmuramoylalanyl-D-glutamate--2,6-diaminopimelate ligase [Natronincola ferrireducens]